MEDVMKKKSSSSGEPSGDNEKMGAEEFPKFMKQDGTNNIKIDPFESYEKFSPKYSESNPEDNSSSVTMTIPRRSPCSIPVLKPNIIAESCSATQDNQNKNMNGGENERGELIIPNDRDNNKCIIVGDRVISIPIFVQKKERTKSFTMTDPDHRFRTYSEILLVQNHPQYLRNISDFQFIKVIGQGAFGNVWLSNDMRTGRQCAIKELFKTELKGRILSSYMREIHTMILVQDRFICPIVGYTIEPPYSIITQFMPGGTLFQALVSTPTRRGPKYGPTQLTIIMLCVAHAMSHIQKCGVIHRDLKAGNILLDIEGLPIIMDFGVSRLMSSDNRHTGHVGTISHMAPEVIREEAYDGKADVFSYGIILYEIGELKRPYKNARADPSGTSRDITKGIRPKFSSDMIPNNMKNLIVKCWQDDPTKRPSFDAIFQILSEGKTHFKGANPEKIKKFAQDLLRDDAVRATTPKQEPMVPTTDTEDIIKRLTRKLRRKGPLRKTLVKEQAKQVQDFAQTVVDKMIQRPNIRRDSMDLHKATLVDIPMPRFCDNDDEIKENPDDPRFKSFINYQIEKIDVVHFSKFYQILAPMIANPCLNTRYALNSVYKLCDRNNVFLKLIRNEHFFFFLQLDKEYDDDLLQILSLYFTKAPELINSSFNRTIAYFINTKPREIICLCSHYVLQLERIDDPFPLLDFIQKYARVYLERDSGAQFIDLYFYLFTYYSEYKESRIDKFKPILTAFVRSTKPIVAEHALKAVFELYDDSFTLNMKTLIRYLSNFRFRRFSLAVIERINEYPLSKTFTKSISAHLNEYKMASNILLKFASQSSEHAEMMTQTTTWMKSKGEQNIRIFLYLFSQKELRDKLASAPEFPKLMLNIARMKNQVLIDFTGSILKRIVITPELLDKLDAMTFFKTIVGSTKKNPSLIKSAILILDVISKIKYLPSYALFVPMMIAQLPLQSDLTFIAIHGLTLLSFHKELRQMLSTPAVVNYFSELNKIQAQKKHALTFLNNILRK